MTTGIPTVNSHTIIIHAYRLLVFACTAGFAVYDLRTRRVPDRALLFFCPVALAAPFLNALDACMPANAFVTWDEQTAMSMALTAALAEKGLSRFLAALLPALLSSLAGAAAGFLILLAAALFSKYGTGVGGGDIKLAAAMGFAYGPSRMITILLAASGLASIVSLIMAVRQKKSDEQKSPSLPFVPFLAIGSLAVTLSAFL